LQNWRHPPSFTTMHRSSIARISGNKIVLDGTTMEGDSLLKNGPAGALFPRHR